jgi:hypothetical protein
LLAGKRGETVISRRETVRKRREMTFTRHETVRKRHEITVTRDEKVRKRHEITVTRREITVSSFKSSSFLIKLDGNGTVEEECAVQMKLPSKAYPHTQGIVLTGLRLGVVMGLRVRAVGGSTRSSGWSNGISRMAI